MHIASPPTNLLTNKFADTYIGIFAKIQLEKMIQRGFTSIRDAGGELYGVASAMNAGLIDGPRLFYSGRALSQTGGHGDFRDRTIEYVPCACNNSGSIVSRIADGTTEVRKAVRDELRRGATQIKIMASGGVASPNDSIHDLQYSMDEMRAIVEEAQAKHTYVMAHVFSPEGIIRCLEAGIRSIEHGFLLDDKSANMMRKKNAYLVPTFSIMDSLSRNGKKFGFPEDSLNKLNEVQSRAYEAIKHAKNNKVKIGLGSDVFGELMDDQENEIQIRSKIEPIQEVLASATEINAEILNMNHEIGKIEENFLADLIAVKGDPIQDPNLLLKQGKYIHLVVKDGNIMKNIIN